MLTSDRFWGRLFMALAAEPQPRLSGQERLVGKLVDALAASSTDSSLPSTLIPQQSNADSADSMRGRWTDNLLGSVSILVGLGTLAVLFCGIGLTIAGTSAYGEKTLSVRLDPAAIGVFLISMAAVSRAVIRTKSPSDRKIRVGLTVLGVAGLVVGTCLLLTTGVFHPY